MRETILKCDIEDRKHNGEVKTLKLMVIFDHDQDDGKSKTEPYFEYRELELCEGCKKFMLENRRHIYGYGAMGFNKYYLKDLSIPLKEK